MKKLCKDNKINILLILWGFGYFLIFVMFLFIKRLRLIYNDFALPPDNMFLSNYVLIILILLLGWYILFYYLFKNKIDKKFLRIIYIILGSVFVLLLFVEPLTSADIYNYIFSAKLFSFYKVNPYISTFNEFSNDALYSYTVLQWRDKVSPYGPIWMLFSKFIYILAKGNLNINIIIYRFLSLFIIILLGININTYLIKQKIEIGKRYLLLSLYYLNPLIIFEVFLNLHNDIYFSFFILLSILLLIKKNYLLSFIALWVSVLIKYISIILLPVYIIYTIKNKKSLKLFYIVPVLLLFTYISFYSFGPINLELFYGLVDQFRKTEQVYYFAPLAWLLFNILNGILKINILFSYFKYTILALFFISYNYLLIKYTLYKDNKDLLNNDNKLFLYILYFVFLYLLLASFWLQSWYLLWGLPLLFCIKNNYKYYLIIWITAWGLMAYYFTINGFIFATLVVILLIRIWQYLNKKILKLL